MKVLDTILHADRALFQQSPCLAEAAVVVHLSSHLTVGPCLTADHMLSMPLDAQDPPACLHMFLGAGWLSLPCLTMLSHNTSCTGLTLWSH